MTLLTIQGVSAAALDHFATPATGTGYGGDTRLHFHIGCIEAEWILAAAEVATWTTLVAATEQRL